MIRIGTVTGTVTAAEGEAEGEIVTVTEAVPGARMMPGENAHGTQTRRPGGWPAPGAGARPFVHFPRCL